MGPRQVHHAWCSKAVTCLRNEQAAAEVEEVVTAEAAAEKVDFQVVAVEVAAEAVAEAVAEAAAEGPGGAAVVAEVAAEVAVLLGVSREVAVADDRSWLLSLEECHPKHLQVTCNPTNVCCLGFCIPVLNLLLIAATCHCEAECHETPVNSYSFCRVSLHHEVSYVVRESALSNYRKRSSGSFRHRFSSLL